MPGESWPESVPGCSPRTKPKDVAEKDAVRLEAMEKALLAEPDGWPPVHCAALLDTRRSVETVFSACGWEVEQIAHEADVQGSF